MQENRALQKRLEADGLTQVEFAERVNGRLQRAGRRGSVTDRTVRYWLSGKTQWPQQAVRDALEAEFGCPIDQLGFARPAWARATMQEDDMHRRTFLAATAATALPLPSTPFRVGFADFERLRHDLATLTTLDHRSGGNGALEGAALAGVNRVLQLSQGASSSRVNQRLLGLAADYTAMAAWSCIDARQFDRARTHLERTLALAGMADDSTVQMRAWNLMSILAHSRGRALEAVAAAQAAQKTSVCRRDALYTSLAHARTAVGHAGRSDRQGALRSLGYAEEALSRADEQMRPGWTAFYNIAEFRSLTAIVHGRLGDHAYAEAASHQALAAIPNGFRRNRAQATVVLASSQLTQGDVDPAVHSAHTVLDLMAGDPLPMRMRTLLGDFHRSLLTMAPDTPQTREWADRARREWSR